MNVTVSELQARYPNPKPGISEDGYCVGGALCLFLGHPIHFPGWSALALALLRANATLDEDLAGELAVYITEANDEGNFDDAWAWLDKALSA